jgi:hypothetical protein
MLRHPQPDVTADGDHDTAAYGTDCGSCHMGGFEQALLPDPYPYVAAPFVGFYDSPWWFSRRPGWTTGGAAGSGGAGVEADRVVGDDVRIIGSRGPATVPRVYTPPSGGTGSTSGTSTTPAATPPPESDAGQQPGRTMKESLDSKEPAPPKKKETDKPKDGSGG